MDGRVSSSSFQEVCGEERRLVIVTWDGFMVLRSCIMLEHASRIESEGITKLNGQLSH